MPPPDGSSSRPVEDPLDEAVDDSLEEAVEDPVDGYDPPVVSARDAARQGMPGWPAPGEPFPPAVQPLPAGRGGTTRSRISAEAEEPAAVVRRRRPPHGSASR